MFRNANPMFTSVDTNYDTVSESQATYAGVTIKTLLLLGIAGISGVIFASLLYRNPNSTLEISLLVLSSIIGIITILLGRSNPKRAMVCSIIYSICEGTFLGSITMTLDGMYSGIAGLAILSTVLIFLVCLVLFSVGVIRVNGKFISIVFTFIASLISITMVLMLCSALHIPGISTFISNNIGLCIGIEALFLIYGAITLNLNFSEVTSYVQTGASKDFEWVGSFGLLVSILYIYIEALRLLALIKASDD